MTASQRRVILLPPSKQLLCKPVGLAGFWGLAVEDGSAEAGVLGETEGEALGSAEAIALGSTDGATEATASAIVSVALPADLRVLIAPVFSVAVVMV